MNAALPKSRTSITPDDLQRVMPLGVEMSALQIAQACGFERGAHAVHAIKQLVEAGIVKKRMVKHGIRAYTRTRDLPSAPDCPKREYRVQVTVRRTSICYSTESQPWTDKITLPRAPWQGMPA